MTLSHMGKSNLTGLGQHMRRLFKFPGRSCPTPSNRDKMNWKSESSLSRCLSGEDSLFLWTPMIKEGGQKTLQLFSLWGGLLPAITQPDKPTGWHNTNYTFEKTIATLFLPSSSTMAIVWWVLKESLTSGIEAGSSCKSLHAGPILWQQGISSIPRLNFYPSQWLSG